MTANDIDEYQRRNIRVDQLISRDTSIEYEQSDEEQNPWLVICNNMKYNEPESHNRQVDDCSIEPVISILYHVANVEFDRLLTDEKWMYDRDSCLQEGQPQLIRHVSFSIVDDVQERPSFRRHVYVLLLLVRTNSCRLIYVQLTTELKSKLANICR
jgi:hypothetical protein